MIDESQGEKKLTAPSTKEISSIKHSEKNITSMTPQNLFLSKDDLNTAEKPSKSDPEVRNKDPKQTHGLMFSLPRESRF